MKQHAQLSNLLLRMISQVFHEGRVFRNCHDHVLSPPHLAYRCPHLLRRKKAGKVSWTATSFEESSVTTRVASSRSSEFAGILCEKRVFEGGPNWLWGSSKSVVRAGGMSGIRMREKE